MDHQFREVDHGNFCYAPSAVGQQHHFYQQEADGSGLAEFLGQGCLVVDPTAPSHAHAFYAPSCEPSLPTQQPASKLLHQAKERDRAQRHVYTYLSGEKIATSKFSFA
jgi:hypothetical protein